MHQEIESTERGSRVPEFGAWNKNTEQAEGYTDIFNQVTDRKPGHRLPRRPTKSFGDPRQAMTILNEPRMIHSADSSQATKLSSPPVAKTKDDIESKKADEGCSMTSVDSHAKLLAVESTSLVEQSPIQPRMGARGSGCPTSSFDVANAHPAPNSGTGRIGYKAMDKLKQRVSDVVSYKKNIGVLQNKTQLLMEEVAKVQCLLISGENDCMDEVQYWLAKVDEILKGANGILEGRNNRADKKRLCSIFWDPTSSWETGKVLRDIDKILEEKKGLDSSSYFGELPYYKELQSRENKLKEVLEALMNIHINMIGIYGMIGVGKTVLAKELARRAQNNMLFDATVMVQVSDHLDVKLIQAQIAKKIGLQLSETDDEEIRAHFLYNALDVKIMERGENDIEPVQQKKILVILDAVQCVIDLGKVGIPYGQEGRASCKVVLVSRNADICKKMGAEKQFLVECLNLDEAKILFQENLGDKIESMDVALERVQYMENVFLIKCRGLPLVIYSLACALRSMNLSSWEIIIDKLERHTLVEVDQVKKVPHAILELFNNFIQNGQRRKLFLLCCLVQQGMALTSARLIRYAIGLALFEDDSLASIVDQIHSWVDELKTLSLLLESREPQHFMVHDIVRDVSISALSQGDFIVPILLDAGTCWHSREFYENCIAISMLPGSNYRLLNGLELQKLETFLLKGKASLSVPNHFFQAMQSLKILDISGIAFLDFPSSIGDLKNLVTLHLEYCDLKCGFISTISNLSKLEVLSLRESRVEALTEEIGNLTNLRVLDLTRCKNLRTFCVDAVAKLDRLEALYLYGNCWDWSTDDMEKLKSLHLEELEITIPEACPLSLNVFNLRRFMIVYIGSFFVIPQRDFSSFSRVLLFNGDGGLQLQETPLRDLLPWTEFLLIDGVSGLSNGVGDLNIHEFLHLKDLHLRMCSEVKCILDTTKLSIFQRDIFPELEILTLTSLEGLTSICRCLPHHSFFPRLRELRLKDLCQLHPYVLPAQLASKLRILEVSKCRSLLNIFPTAETSVTDGADSCLELPYMERLELKDLTSLVAFQEWSDASTTSDGHQKHCALLFNGKIKLPSLQNINLMGLCQIENLWDFLGSKECSAQVLQNQTWVKEPYARSPCFANLKYITVSDCNNLESLFSSEIADSLSQLEKLEVGYCNKMREVITSGIEDDTNHATMITFPKLQILTLTSLSRLQCFYQGHLLLNFPMLRELDLSVLFEMKAFTLPNTHLVQTEGTILFDNEVAFPCLEHLRVSSMGIELLKRNDDVAMFPNLSRLTLHDLQNLKSLPNINSKTLRYLVLLNIECFKVLFSIQPTYMPSMPFVMSQKLEELLLSESDYLEVLLEDEGLVDHHSHSDIKLLYSLRKLELRRLHQLKNIPWNILTNLRSLIVTGLNKGWTSLISSSLLVRGNVLPLLEYIQVADCSSLEAIISEELFEDEDFIKYGITLFPCLRRIELHGLPKLEIFSLGKYEAHFPSLETVTIQECHSMRTFSLGPLRTPRLKYVKLESKIMEADTFVDLNGAVEGLIEIYQAAAKEERVKIATIEEGFKPVFKKTPWGAASPATAKEDKVKRAKIQKELEKNSREQILKIRNYR